MELFRYTTSKKFMYFGKRKCMVESCVPFCKRQLFSCDEELVTNDVTSQYQESLAPNQNRDWVTCLKSNLEIDCTVSMNKFQLYLEVLNESLEISESDCESINGLESDCESINGLESDFESIEELESDCESIEASESDCASIEELESDCEIIKALKSEMESIGTSDFDCDSIEALEYDTVWIKDSDLNKSNVNFSDSALSSELNVLEYTSIDPGHFENSGTVLYDSGFCSDTSVNFGSDLLCSDMYFHSNDNSDVIAEGQYHNDVMLSQDENVIMDSEMQWVTSPETQTIGMNDCNDFAAMSEYYSGSTSNELFPVNFMEE